MILMRGSDVQPIVRQSVADVRALEQEDGLPKNSLHQLAHPLRLDQLDVRTQAVKGVVIDCAEVRTRPDWFGGPRRYDALFLQHPKEISSDLKDLAEVEGLPEEEIAVLP